MLYDEIKAYFEIEKHDIIAGEIVALYRERIVKTIEIGTQKSFVSKIELFAKFTNDKFEFVVSGQNTFEQFETLFDAVNYIASISHTFKKVNE